MAVLDGLKVVEIAGLGPGPFAAMMLADMGADVLRVDRPFVTDAETLEGAEEFDLVNRGRPSVVLDLKDVSDRARLLEVVSKADALIEGFRPGVMERLGVGPNDCSAVNARLVYVRVTGWGQDGALSHTAGHDGNYLARSGLLGLLGPPDGPPAIPLNVVGDLASGGLMAVIGLLGALLERGRSGKGQVVDAAIVDGATLLTAGVHSYRLADRWRDRGQNLLDGGAPYYNTYETADGGYVAFCAIEDKFFDEFLRLAEVDPTEFSDRKDPSNWEDHRRRLMETFGRRTKSEWAELTDGSDACVSPVHELEDVFADAHLADRGVLKASFGVRQPQPCPRYLRTPSAVRSPPSRPGEGGDDLLARWGIRASSLRSGDTTSSPSDG